MNRFVLFSFATCMLLSVASCANDDYVNSEMPSENEQSCPAFIKLSEVLNQNLTSETTPADFYLVYDSSDGEVYVMSDEEYELINSITEYVSGENTRFKAPSGKGLKNAGTYKDRFDGVTKAVNKIKKEIPAKQNFELRVEYNTNGTFTVWWRPV